MHLSWTSGWAILISLSLLPGCFRSTPIPAAHSQRAATSQPTPPLRIATISEPLTETEVTAFLTIVSELPASPLDGSEHPRLTTLIDAPQISVAVDELRRDYRRVLEPGYQAQRWCANPAVRTAILNRQIEPEAFASLAVRISCAWSALSISSQAPLAESSYRLDQQIERLVIESDRPTVESSPWERDQLLRSLEETIALSEFLRLLKAVPDESLRIVRGYSDELRSLLPQPSSTAAFQRRMESSHRIMPASHVEK